MFYHRSRIAIKTDPGTRKMEIPVTHLIMCFDMYFFGIGTLAWKSHWLIRIPCLFCERWEGKNFENMADDENCEYSEGSKYLCHSDVWK